MEMSLTTNNLEDFLSPFEVFDAHTHIGNFQDFNVSLSGDGLKELMAECRLSKTLVFAPDNSLVEDLVGREENIKGLVWVNPKDKGSLDILPSFLEKKGFVGIKLHPLFDGYMPDSEVMVPAMEAAEEFSCPVLVHCGHPPFTLPWSFSEPARRFPEVDIVLGHMGHGHIVYVNAAIKVAQECPNIYLETSGMPMHTKIREAVELVGDDRVLYGSDAPFGHPVFELSKFMVAGLDEDVLRKVLSGNAERIFGE